MSTPITSQDIKAYSQQVRPFWENVLASRAGTAEPATLSFAVKICYVASDGIYAGQLVARMFPSEFKQAHGVYFELINFQFESYFAPVRKLVWLAPFNPESKYPFIDNGKGGQFQVPVAELKEIYTYDPAAESATVIEEVVQEAAVHHTEEVVAQATEQMLHPASFEDQDLPDLNQNQLTARDKYCLDHSVPQSNKAWINELVTSGNAYLKTLHP